MSRKSRPDVTTGQTKIVTARRHIATSICEEEVENDCPLHVPSLKMQEPIFRPAPLRIARGSRVVYSPSRGSVRIVPKNATVVGVEFFVTFREGFVFALVVDQKQLLQ